MFVHFFEINLRYNKITCPTAYIVWTYLDNWIKYTLHSNHNVSFKQLKKIHTKKIRVIYCLLAEKEKTHWLEKSSGKSCASTVVKR